MAKKKKPATPRPDDIQCFFLEPTDTVALWLRRYAMDTDTHYHNTLVRIEDAPARRSADGYLDSFHPIEFSTDPRWPTACECGHVYDNKAIQQVFQDLIYRRTDTGETYPLRKAPVGAMWWSTWAFTKGHDGRALVVRVPGPHDWLVDARANNCTRPDDRLHRCWIREGEPPNVTVSKGGENADTCDAGAGSILTDTWHGFLRGGKLVSTD